MRFNDHSRLAGRHAFLSASKYHWIRYSEDKLVETFKKAMTAQRGTELHAFAHTAIRLGIRMPGNGKTLSLYINDAIGYKMVSEQPLYYSENCFGTPDTMGFRRNKLRIHDLKNGTTKCSFDQLKVYAAMFCLEYKYKPHEIEIELRIYQNDEILVFEGIPEEIAEIMETIVNFDQKIDNIILEEMS